MTSSVVAWEKESPLRDEDKTAVVAYEPVRTRCLRHRRNFSPAVSSQQRPGGLRVCKARLTLSFSVYIVTGGTLLTVGTFLLSGVLFVIALFALGFSAFIAGTWLFFSKAINMVNKASQKIAPKPVLPSPPQERSLQHVD